MAKRKKKSAAGLLSVLPVIVIVLAVYCFVLHTPDNSKIVEKIDAKEDISALQSNLLDGLLGVVGSLTNEATPESIVTIADAREDKTKYGTVYYYESGEDAKKAAADFKENRDEDSENVIFKRGDAVYVGSKECLYIYLSVIY